ncbi:MAG: DNA polymerase/3'-5' exonuclease PolX [Bacteroidetes bacterium]|nr:DNA polymerase/3'-5' exonuclease PolX [Bacteroidota bacterium]
MTTDNIADLFKLYSQLLDLHDLDSFKSKTYANASFRIDKLGLDLLSIEKAQLEKVEGLGKSLISKIEEIKVSGSFSELDVLAQKTPIGVVEMLKIKGIGPKKVGLIWRELQIESVGELLYACNENRLVDLKGFGEKTQASIIQSIKFIESNEGLYHYATAEIYAANWQQHLQDIFKPSKISYTGDLRRKCEILNSIDFCLESEYHENSDDAIKQFYPFDNKTLTGNQLNLSAQGLPNLTIYFCSTENFVHTLFITTGNSEHLKNITTNENTFQTEEELYTLNNIPYIEPELREGLNEIENAKAGKYNHLIENSDLKGILHNHSKWSDGINTIEEMAKFCIDHHFEYLGMCDHSKTAVYANGLSEERVRLQHQEIDALNIKLAPFKIFKGIESDILSDGSLDYSDDVLSTFDFVVASVHQNLKMDEDKATTRLIKAIENKYTTILGHPTGRLLLSRPGYPIDYKKVIDACAAHGVVIEINAHPYRLDLDWRWIDYAMSKSVILSINPDAHKKEGLLDMYYGVCAARKGGLSKDFTLNALPLSSIENFFKNRRNF